jgi:pimeloyl-ACP methyl ester carboxylesterase
VTLDDGQPINVVELGEGPPLVFIHGLLGRWTHWVEQLTAFAAGRSSIGHRVIAFDLPGFGDSPLPAEGGVSVPIYARTVARLMQALEISTAAFVGQSMGGFTAIELAINHPELVERLVLVSPAGLSTYMNPRDVMTLKQIRRLSRLVAAGQALTVAYSELLARRPRLRRLEPVTNIVTRYPERIPGPYVFEFARGLAPPGFVEGMAANQDYDYRERLGEVACPTLIVWGERDKVVTVKDAAEYERLIPNARKVIFADTGHMTMIERPDAFNALLQEFLEE